MSRFHDDNTCASDPLPLRLDRGRLARIHPEAWWSRVLGLRRRRIDVIDEHLSFGDSRAALVVSAKPLWVSAYTDELDCSIVLQFSERERAQIETEVGRMSVGRRLVTINTYGRGTEPFSDLWNGPASDHNYANFFPVIADFCVVDPGPLRERIEAIDASEWRRCELCAEEYLSRNGGRLRAGSPFRSFLPV